MESLDPNDLPRVWLVYAGPRKLIGNKYRYWYFQLDDLAQNISSTKLEKLRKWEFDDKPFKLGTVGSIYPIRLKDENTMSYNAKIEPIGYWQNDDHRTEWRAHETAAKTTKAHKSAMMENTLIKRLEPIRNAYRNSSIEDKRFILAETIRIITQP